MFGFPAGIRFHDYFTIAVSQRTVPVSLTDVEYVAMLARLSFSEDEKETLTHHLNDILKYVDQLNSLDTTHVEPLLHVIELGNTFRNDEVRQTVTQEEALKNAPSKSVSFYSVPKVIRSR